MKNQEAPTPNPIPQPFIQACCAHEFPNPLKIFTFEQPTPGNNMIFFCFAMNTAQHQVGPTRGQPAPSFPRGSPKGKKTKKTKFNPKTEIGLTHWGKTKGSIKAQVDFYPTPAIQPPCILTFGIRQSIDYPIGR